MLRQLVELGDDQAHLDQLGAGADDGENLAHAYISRLRPRAVPPI